MYVRMYTCTSEEAKDFRILQLVWLLQQQEKTRNIPEDKPSFYCLPSVSAWREKTMMIIITIMIMMDIIISVFLQ